MNAYIIVGIAVAILILNSVISYMAGARWGFDQGWLEGHSQGLQTSKRLHEGEHIVVDWPGKDAA